MKKFLVTLCAAAMTLAVFAQQLDSTTSSQYQSDFQLRDFSVGETVDSQSTYTPQPRRLQQQTSPIIQQRFQTQPSLQYLKRESQPGLRLQPLQTNPRIPSQTQPLDLNNGNQNQFDRSIQPPVQNTDIQRPV